MKSNSFAAIIITCLILSVAPIFATAQKPFAGGAGKYTKLVWAEEFKGKGLPDTSRWNFEVGYIRNKELQYYTNARLANATVANGMLTITAINDSFDVGGKAAPITSACINTKNKKEFTYGRVEVRAKLPSSLGTWPAIWMLGANKGKAGWPLCGEIDIMEHVGYMPDTVHFNVHTQKYNHVKKTGKGTKVGIKDPAADFHVYAIEWFTDHIDWFMDDQKVFTYANEGEGKTSWPFDEPEYIILNLAFGGSWGGSKGVDISSLPQKFLIDYVRVFQ